MLVYNAGMSKASAAGASRAPNPVLSLLGRLLEAALNRAIGLDPETGSRLRSLDGRAVTVTARGTPLSIRFRVEGDRLRVGPAGGHDSGLRVAMTPGVMIGLLLRRGDEAALAPGAVDIAGDADLARRLQRLASEFEPDIDEAFARTFGDVPGFQLARVFRHALDGARSATTALAADGVAFLRDETRDVVGRFELDDFLDDVDALRERGDRLDARIGRLLRGHGHAA